MFVSKLVGMQTLQQLKLDGITALPVTAGATQKFSLAVKKGDAELLARLNEALALAKSSGDYDALYQKWFSVFEDKEPTLRDMLKYWLPLLAVFVGYAGLSYYRQRVAHRQLAESHHMLQTIIETIPMRVFWKDRNSRYLGCNRLLAWDAGQDGPAEVIGKSDTDFSWHEQASLYRSDDLTVISSGKSKLAYDEPMTTMDGSLVWLRTSKTPLRNLNGDVIGVLGVFDDITERKLAAQALVESESRLSENLENVSA
jgi:PAS domain S-box-containing protein